MKTVTWTRMEEGTREEFDGLDAAARAHTSGALVDNLLMNLGRLRGPTLGYQIDRYEHSLQSATRALRAGESIDLVVGALLHDIGDSFAPEILHLQTFEWGLHPHA